MAYKTAFKRLERLESGGWRRMVEAPVESSLGEPLVLPTRRLRSRLLIDA